MSGTPGRVVYKDKVLKYLAKNPGITVWRDDVGIALGLEPSQVSSVLGQAIRDKNPHIIVVESGKAWRWTETTNPPKSKAIFEELARLDDGRILAKDENEVVYWVTKVQ